MSLTRNVNKSSAGLEHGTRENAGPNNKLVQYAVYFVLSVTIINLGLFFPNDDPSEMGGLAMYIRSAAWLSGAALLVVAVVNRQRTALGVSAAVFSVLLAFFLASSVYAPNMFKTIAAATSMICTYAVVQSYTMIYGRIEMARLLIHVLTFVVVISVFMYFLLPSVGRLAQWDGTPGARLSGLSGHPQELGLMSSVLIFLLFAYRSDLRYSRIGAMLVILFSFGAIFLAQSRTSFFSAAIACTALWAISRRSHFEIMLFVLPALVLCAGASWVIWPEMLDTVAATLSRSGDPRELTTATGRTFIWDYSLFLISKSWLIGYGYNSTYFMFAEAAEMLRPYVGSYVFPHAHNLILQMMLSGGIVATAMFMVCLIHILLSSTARRDYRTCAFLLMYLIVSFAEAGGFFQYANLSFIWISFLVASVSPGGRTSTIAPA